VLADEEKLTFKMLYAMDGNDSLKRVIHRILDNLNDSDSVHMLSSELPTGQTLMSDRYPPRTFVDKFAQNSPSVCQDSAPPENSCKGRWKNMDSTKTKKAWGVYDKIGVFVAVCQHSFCLLIADMVQSGEL
jgi:hypothetical protein